MNLKKIVLTLLLGVLPFILSASHILGGEITWRCNGNKQFIFQVKIYRDCNGIPGPQNVRIYTNAPFGPFYCYLLSQTDISPQGFGCGSCAIPMGLYGSVEEYIYESGPMILIGSAPSTGWYFYYNDCCHNAAISNLANPDDFSLRAYIYPSVQGFIPCFDNSPYFAEPPTIGICTRDSVNLSFAAFDRDLDSLKYEFAPTLNNGFPGNNAIYATGYSFGSPLPGIQQDSMNVPAILDTASGQVSLTSYTPGHFIICMQVTSYRCGQIISKVFREYILMIKSNCTISTNPPTTFNTSPDILPLPHAETITISAGDTLNYTFSASENELLPASAGGNSQTMTMRATSLQLGFGDTSSTNGCLVPPCAVLSNPTPFSSTANLSQVLTWPTECQHVGFNNGCLQHTKDYHFIFTIKDNYCPVPGVTTKSLLVKVAGPTIYSLGNSLAVHSSNLNVQWFLNGTPIMGATDTLFNPTQSGTYSLVAFTNNGCTLISNSIDIGFAGVPINSNPEAKLDVFPNPSVRNTILNVLLQNAKTGPNEIQVIDITGKLVMQIPIYVSTTNEHLLIDLGGLANGVYTINLSGDGKIPQTQLLLTN